jgi:hypothetical protein
VEAWSQALCAVLQRSPASPSSARHAAAALANLCVNNLSNQHMLLECGGLTHLLAVLKAYAKAAKHRPGRARSLLGALGLSSSSRSKRSSFGGGGAGASAMTSCASSVHGAETHRSGAETERSLRTPRSARSHRSERDWEVLVQVRECV